MKLPRQPDGHTSSASSDYGRYWRFAKAVRERTRFVFDVATAEFIELVRKQVKSRSRHIAKDTLLWRSRSEHGSTSVEINKGEFEDQIAPCAPDEMIPSVVSHKRLELFFLCFLYSWLSATGLDRLECLSAAA